MNDVLAAFLRAVEDDLWSLRSPAVEKWRKKFAAPAEGSPCQFCGQVPDEPLVLAHIVSVELGGAHSTENLLPGCKACMQSAKVSDPISWKTTPRNLAHSLAARRLDALAVSENHLLRTRKVAKTKPYVVKLLTHRWQHPRVLVRACLTEHGGLLAFAQHTPMPEGTATLIKLNGGQSVRGAPRVFHVEAAGFLNLIWLLIDRNAIVRHVALDDFPDPTPEDDGASRWRETYTSIHNIARRGKSQRGLVPPSPWYEKPMDPRTRRHLAAMLALKTNQPLDEEWLARHRAADEAFMEESRRQIRRWARLY